MILYHYTCREHLDSILSDTYLRPSESNIGSPMSHMKPYGAHYGPDVVWLTTDNNARRGQHGLLGPANKARIRFTIEIEAIPWRSFAKKHGINKKWYRALNKSGGFSSHLWYVFEGKINILNWKEVRDMDTGEIIYSSKITGFVKE